jgi:hypothetical protein
MQQMHGQSIQHLVTDDRAGNVIRQRIQPMHSVGEVRQFAADQGLLALAQVSANFEDGIALRQRTQPFQFGQNI